MTNIKIKVVLFQKWKAESTFDKSVLHTLIEKKIISSSNVGKASDEI